MATPFWTGDTISFAVNEQFVTSWDTADITAQINANDYAYYALRDKYQNPTQPEYVGVNQVGDGAKFHYTSPVSQWVTFRALGSDPVMGITIMAYKPYLVPGLSSVKGWLKAHYVAYRDADFPHVASVSVPLDAGEHIVLDVGFYSSGSGHLDEIITLTAEQTTIPTNDTVATATDVVIAANGGTYQSYRVLNDFLTDNSDNPSGSYLKRTAWWKYAADGAGEVLYTVNADPEGDTTVRATVWGVNDQTQTLYEVGQFGQGETWGEILPAYSVRYIQVGGNHDWISVGGIYYDLQVTGRKTAIPDVHDPLSDDDPPVLDTKLPRSDPEDPGDEGPYIPIPDTVTPAVNKDLTETTLLDLIRTFSGEATRAVRIIGASTIEIVDPAEPIPDGWSRDDTAEYYTSTTQRLAASAQAISLKKGRMDLEASADIRADDIGIITSGWRIPQRLPVHGTYPAPVKRVSYTISPTGFRANVEFQFMNVPLQVRRT